MLSDGSMGFALGDPRSGPGMTVMVGMTWNG